MFTSFKKPLKSITIWGGLVSLFPAIVEITDKALATGILPPNIAVVVSAVGGVAAIVGRFIAKSKISF